MVFKQVFGKRTLLLALMVGMLGVLLVACSEDEDPDDAAATSSSGGSAAATETMASGIDYGSLSGEVQVDGSSTVFPISEAVAEEFSLVPAAALRSSAAVRPRSRTHRARSRTPRSRPARPTASKVSSRSRSRSTR